MVREIRAAPLLFGYRGSEQVDVDAVEHLLLRRRPAQERPAPGPLRSTSSWCWSALAGATVLTAVGRVEPAADARSDWYVRRLAEREAGETTRRLDGRAGEHARVTD